MEKLIIHRQGLGIGIVSSVVSFVMAIIIYLNGGGKSLLYLFLFLTLINIVGTFTKKNSLVLDEVGCLENKKYKIKWSEIRKIKKFTNFSVKFETILGKNKSLHIFDVGIKDRKRILIFLRKNIKKS